MVTGDVKNAMTSRTGLKLQMRLNANVWLDTFSTLLDNVKNVGLDVSNVYLPHNVLNVLKVLIVM